MQLAERFDVHPNQIAQWKSPFPERAAQLLAGGSPRPQEGPQLLELSRASICYRPVAISAGDLQLMRRIDALHLELPFAGSRI